MKKNDEYIIDYLENKLSEEDKKDFELQIQNSSELQKEVEELAFIWRTSDELKLYKNVDTKRHWEKMAHKIKQNNSRISIVKFARSAAAILLFPVLILTLFLYNKINNLNDQPVEYVETTVPGGTFSKIILSDGTEVWLNSGSMLSYPQQFRQSHHRTVHLSGEAYFKVKSDRSNPFDVVVSNELIVSACGTEFNISSYKEDNIVDVTLVSGNVRLQDITGKVSHNLAPGQQALYNKEDKTTSVSPANLAVKTGWKDGKMIFRRTDMTEVIHRLSRRFNVDIQLHDKELYDYEYSATFTTETLSEILELLSKTAPIQYKIIESEQSADIPPKRIIILSLKK